MGVREGGESMKWIDMTLAEFQLALASSEPTPGGGTAAAIALGQATSLTMMVTSLTILNTKWADGHEAAHKAEEVCNELYLRTGDLAQLDSEAFEQVMKSFQMHKTTEDEIKKRKNTIRKSMLNAAEIPFQTAELGMKLLNCLEELAIRGNGNAVSDVGVAALLASAAVKGALFNVEINLQSLPIDTGVGMRSNIDKIRLDCSKVSRRVMHAVHERIHQ